MKARSHCGWLIDSGGDARDRADVILGTYWGRTIHAAHAALEAWIASEKGGAALPTRGLVAVGLVVLDRLKSAASFRVDDHLAPGGGQVAGLSARAVDRICRAHGEPRTLTKEGGRTNRASPAQAERLLAQLEAAGLGALAAEARAEVLDRLQRRLVAVATAILNGKALEPAYDARLPARDFIAQVLALAERSGKRGPVAQYLVGATLQCQFPDVRVSNDQAFAADDQGGRHGDFTVGDRVVHVTVAPSLGHYEKCRRNLADGLRPLLLVPEGSLVGTRQNVAAPELAGVAVESIETFVGLTLELLGGFTSQGLRRALGRFLRVYNDRVDAAETDKSIMVEPPKALAGPEEDR